MVAAVKHAYQATPGLNESESNYALYETSFTAWGTRVEGSWGKWGRQSKGEVLSQAAWPLR